MLVIAEWLNHNRHRILSWFREDLFRRLVRNARILLTANGATALLKFAVAVLSARALGPAGYGMLALVLVYSRTVGKVVSFTVWQAIVRFGSEALDQRDADALRKLVKFGFLLDAGSAVVGTGLAVVLSGPTVLVLGWDTDIQPLLILYSLLILFSLNGTATGVMRLFDRFDLLGYCALMPASTRLVGVLYCYVTNQGIVVFVLVYLLTEIGGQVFALITAWVLLRRHAVEDLFMASALGVFRRFPGIWTFVWTTQLSTTIRMLSRELDELIIAGVTSPSALGLFKVAKQFSLIPLTLTDPLYHAIYPELSKLWVSGRQREFLSLMKRVTFFALMIGVSGWLGFAALGKVAIGMVVGDSYVDAYPVALVYMVAVVIALGTLTLSPALLAMGRPQDRFVAFVAATVLYFTTLVVATPSIGIQGASISYVVFYLAWAIVMFCYLSIRFQSLPKAQR